MKNKKITVAKIPKEVRENKCIVVHRYAVFCEGLSLAVSISAMLSRKRNIPGYGYITENGKRIYYCLYGYVNDPIVYADNSTK